MAVVVVCYYCLLLLLLFVVVVVVIVVVVVVMNMFVRSEGDVKESVRAIATVVLTNFRLIILHRSHKELSVDNETNLTMDIPLGLMCSVEFIKTDTKALHFAGQEKDKTETLLIK